MARSLWVFLERRGGAARILSRFVFLHVVWFLLLFEVVAVAAVVVVVVVVGSLKRQGGAGSVREWGGTMKGLGRVWSWKASGWQDH